MSPSGTLFIDSENNLYGTTGGGGNRGCQFQLGCGTVFELDASGHETALYAFKGGAAGFYPPSGVVRDPSGNLYGTTPNGGSTNCRSGCGVVFKIDSAGNETVLHTFTVEPTGSPYASGIALDTAGNLYGLTANGGSGNCRYADGAVGCGTVFKITPGMGPSVLYSFQGGNDGVSPAGHWRSMPAATFTERLWAAAKCYKTMKLFSNLTAVALKPFCIALTNLIREQIRVPA